MPPGRPRKNKDDVLLKSADMIGWALGGLEREIMQTRERLATLITQASALRARVGAKATAAVTPAAAGAPEAAGASAGASAGRKRKRRKMSAEARKRISENLRKRWADAKKAGKTRLQKSR